MKINLALLTYTVVSAVIIALTGTVKRELKIDSTVRNTALEILIVLIFLAGGTVLLLSSQKYILCGLISTVYFIIMEIFFSKTAESLSIKSILVGTACTLFFWPQFIGSVIYAGYHVDKVKQFSDNEIKP